MKIRIATRNSPLALVQTKKVADLIKIHHNIDPLIIPVSTLGDRNTDASLHQLGQTGVFTRELENALQNNHCDIAVHSMKDLATLCPEGLINDIVLKRDDPRDVLLSKDNISFNDLPPGSCIGTSSLRRTAFILRLRKDLKVEPLRGNVQTRLSAVGIEFRNKTQEPKKIFSATILAKAGLERLGLKNIGHILNPDDFLPAPAQGVIAIQRRKQDNHIKKLLNPLNHSDTLKAVTAERTFLKIMEGGCQVPLGAHGYLSGSKIFLSAMVSNLDGTKWVKGTLEGTDPEETGNLLALRLKEEGATQILEQVSWLLK